MITYKRNINFKTLFKSQGNNCIEDYLPVGSQYLYSSAVRLGLLDVFDSLDFNDNEFVLVPPLCPQGIMLPIERKKIGYKFYNLTDDFKVCIKSVKKLIEGKKCKAIFVIHYFGLFNDQIYEIKELCQKNHVILIEDVVHGLFSKDKDGVPFGVVGDIALYSFPKFIPLPDGAVFIINNPTLNIHFKYKKNILIPLSVFFHVNSLLINSIIAKVSSKILYKVIKSLSLFNYSLYYYLLYSTRSNHQISGLTKRLLSNFDFDEFITKRHNLYSLYNQNLCDYELDQKIVCMPGYPVLTNVSKTELIKSKLHSIGIEPLVYVKGWNYIPQNKGFEKEIELLKSHLLIPFDSKVSEKLIKEVKKILK